MWPSWFVTNICCIFLNIIDAGYTTSLSNYAITINEINSSHPPQKKKITQKFVKKRKHCPELCKKIRKIGLGLKKNKKHLTILILPPPPPPAQKSNELILMEGPTWPMWPDNMTGWTDSIISLRIYQSQMKKFIMLQTLESHTSPKEQYSVQEHSHPQSSFRVGSAIWSGYFSDNSENQSPIRKRSKWNKTTRYCPKSRCGREIMYDNSPMAQYDYYR